MQKIFFLFLLLSIKGFSQSLTVEETIDYLNNLSSEHPGTWTYENEADKYLYFAILGCENKVTYKIIYNTTTVQL